MKNYIVFGLVAMMAGALCAAEAPQGKRGDKFKAADTDADGKLSATEFATASKQGDAAARFGKIDANADGFVTPEEMKAAHEARGGEGHGGKGGKGGGKCGPGGCKKSAPEA